MCNPQGSRQDTINIIQTLQSRLRFNFRPRGYGPYHVLKPQSFDFVKITDLQVQVRYRSLVKTK